MSGTNTSATGGYLLQSSSNAATDDTLTNIFQEMIVGITGLDPTLVRPAWQPQPPTQPPVTTDWCAVAVSSYFPTDYPNFIHNSSGDGNSNLYRVERINTLVSFYGPNCTGYTGILRDGIYVNQNYLMLSTQGIKLRSVEEATYFPELINSQYVPRSDLPMNFTRMIQRTYPVENLLGAEVDIYADTPAPNGAEEVVTISQEN
jgi:hypothetical protein